MTTISTLPRMVAASNRLLLAALLLCCGHAVAALTQEQVASRAAVLYADRLRENALDPDPRFAARVNAIAVVLIAQARRDYPETANWAWEVHTTDDQYQNADCMAGGKILVSKSYVERLDLRDAELAMLLAHEISHATLHHNLKEYEQAMRLQPAWTQRPFLELEDAVEHDSKLIDLLAPLNFAQEAEADREGLRLAWRAGWAPARLAVYFKKMARASGWPNRTVADYPSPYSRWQAARAQAEPLQKNDVQPAD